MYTVPIHVQTPYIRITSYGSTFPQKLVLISKKGKDIMQVKMDRELIALPHLIF